MEPEVALALQLKNEEAVTTKESLAQALRFSIHFNPRRPGEIGVSADVPSLPRLHPNDVDISQEYRRDGDSSRAGESRLVHLAAGEHLP